MGTTVQLHKNTGLKPSILISQILQFRGCCCRNCKKIQYFIIFRPHLNCCVAVGSFLAVTWQLYRFPCHSLSHSVTQSLPLLKNTTKEHSERLVTLETCDQSDKETWPNHFQIFGNFSDFWKLFRLLETFQIFGNFSDFRKSFRFLESFPDFRKISSFSENIQIFGKFPDSRKISTDRVPQKNVCQRFEAQICSRSPILLSRMCFGFRISSLIHQATLTISIQNLKCLKNAKNAYEDIQCSM